MRGLSSYPPGHPTGDSKSEVRLTCRNEDCPEYGTASYAIEVYERDTGAAYLDPEDADICPDCEQERDVEPR